MAKKLASERAARALCALDGHPSDIRFEGAPMWKSYLPQVRVVVAALQDPGMECEGEWERVIGMILAQIEKG